MAIMVVWRSWRGAKRTTLLVCSACPKTRRCMPIPSLCTPPTPVPPPRRCRNWLKCSAMLRPVTPPDPEERTNAGWWSASRHSLLASMSASRLPGSPMAAPSRSKTVVLCAQRGRKPDLASKGATQERSHLVPLCQRQPDAADPAHSRLLADVEAALGHPPASALHRTVRQAAGLDDQGCHPRHRAR